MGGFWFKVHGSAFQEAGLPDLLGCVTGLYIGIEVKAPGKISEVTPIQQYRLSQITAAGGLGIATDNPIEALKAVKKWLKSQRV